MRILKKNRIRALLLSVVFMALFTLAPPAQAIYNGVPVYNINVVKVWQPAFGAAQDRTCTGTLIALGLVITASHCIYNVPASQIEVFFLGEVIPLFVDYYVELGGPIPPTILTASQAKKDVALLILHSTVSPAYAKPVPFGPVFPPSDLATAIGYGSTCSDYCYDYGSQRAVAYFINSNATNHFCPGDSGGPILNGSGGIVGIISVGGCGDYIGYDWYGLPLQYIDTIQYYISLYGGPPDCSATIMPLYGNLSTQFNVAFNAVGPGGSCSYALDNKGFYPISCGTTSVTFAGTNLGAGQHSLMFRIQNSQGSYLCPTSPFTVAPEVGSPSVTINPQALNTNPGGSLTFTANTAATQPTFSWGAGPVAMAPAKGDLFADGLRFNETAGIFLGALKTFASLIPLPASLINLNSFR